MTCETGPANRMFGETMWTVFSCSDNASLLLVAPNGSAAFPYYFLLAPHDTGYHISGEGTGDQKVSQAALNDLRALTRQEIEELLAATKAKK